jgi:hypothetical protein
LKGFGFQKGKTVFSVLFSYRNDPNGNAFT